MFFAVLAAIIAAIAVVGVIAAILLYRQRHSKKHVHINHEVKPLSGPRRSTIQPSLPES